MTEIAAKDRAELLAGLLDGRWEVRRESVLGLMRAPDAGDLPRLTALLHDPKVQVRHAVVVAIAVAHGPAREPEVVPLLVERALTDESLRVRRQAVSMLAWQLAHPDLEGFFAQVAESESDEKLVRFARAGRHLARERAKRAGTRAVLSPEQRAEFEQRGVLCLRGWVDGAAIADLRARALERIRGLVPDPVPPGFAVHASATASLVKRMPFADIWGASSVALVDELVGAGQTVPPGAGQILAATFPTPGAAWRVPHKVWHLDYTAPGSLRGLAGVQLFVCLDHVAPQAGATVVACGTHRLVDALRRREGPAWPGRSQEVRKRLAAEVPWLRALTSLREGEDRVARFVDRAETHEGVALEVAELAGEPGDVFAMHPWLLHAPALNCGDRPRLVLTERVRSKEWMATFSEDAR